MAKVYLICGSTGAGKTYYSESLKNSNSAMVFSIDKWMKQLYWMDAPKDNVNWVMERIQRCETLIKSITEELVKQNTNVILDLGFSEPMQRNDFYSWLKKQNIPYELHYLDIDAETRWKRVQKRNESLNESSIAVDRQTFEWMENYFQAPSESELQTHNGKIIKN